nr:hypothetical protein [Tanacetum cinerariifolium]
TEAVRVAVQIQTNWLPDSYQRENDEFLRTIDENMKRIIKGESAFAEEHVQTTSQMDEPSYLVFKTSADDQPIVQSSQHSEWFSQPKKPLTLDRDWNKTLPALRVDTLTLELLAGPTYELMKGSCTSLIELEYHLEEVYKATTDQLDWVNPEGQQYPHNLLQPLPLIPDNRGRRVVPFAHFINNDLEYLRGVASSRKYTTSVTKTKAAESALDVYSKRRIITVTDLKIMEWHIYKHLDWITRRVEDLQLGVKSYPKRLNLTKPDTYLSDLKRREAYTAYSNPRGFIYQNKDNKNMLIQIDELHKFNDGMLNDVRNALDDHLKGIRMKYLPQAIWRKGDKDRATAIIQAIDKMLKTRRIMRSLERFVGGRLYEGDFWMLQRTV